MTPLSRMLDRVGTVLLYVAAFAAVLLTAFVCLAAIMRYLFGSPFHFTEELVALLFLAMVFLTLPAATSRGQQIRVSLVTSRLRGGWQPLAAGFNLLVILAFAAWFGIEAYGFAAFAHEIGARSEQSSITLWPWMALIPLSAGLVALVALVQLILVLQGRRPDAAAPPRADDGGASPT